MIEARGLSKRYGDKLGVDDLSFTVRPGRVTGFLGPNGAGKTTTMRMILGLDRPTAGSVTVNGKPFDELYSAMREVGTHSVRLQPPDVGDGQYRRPSHRDRPRQADRGLPDG
jgi:ABC-type multidrug transport system ATPase subunit